MGGSTLQLFKKMRPIRYKNKLFCVLAALTFGVIIFLSKQYSIVEFYEDNFSSLAEWSTVATKPPQLRIVSKRIGEQKKEQRQPNLIPQQQGCRFPDLRVDDPEIKHLFHNVPPLVCSKEKNWVYVRNGTFYIDSDAVERHSGAGEPTTITCDYANVQRKSDFSSTSTVERNFKNGTRLRGDFFKVDCRSSKDGATYSNVHASIVPSADAVKRCRSTKPPADALGLDVYMIGYDSISRMTFMRMLPKTYRYLTETMGSIVLKGYNIVGDGTPQALIPILTGKTETELPMTRKRFRNAQFVNVYPFVWNDFRNAGYVTMYGEDAPRTGTFTYRLKGFDEQPTDHYLRTFYNAYEDERGHHKKFCMGSEPNWEVHFRYAEHFWEMYPPDIRKFAFLFHAVISHDNINEVSLVDDYMVQHLRFFVERGHFNNTIIVFMSDHGHRFDSLRETQPGKLEERLPFFSFAFPPWFAKKYPAAMKAFKGNADRLTTPFDIHATLMATLNFQPEARVADLKDRGLSLFESIPATRSCADARIEPHWCSCLVWTEISTQTPMVRLMARGLVRAINLETERERKSCSILKLVRVMKASRYTPPDAILKYQGARDKDGFVPDLTANTPMHAEYYQIDIRTSPGNAHYEASVIWDKRLNEVVVDLDAVSHVNKYGDLPHCVIEKDYFLAKWCVCLDMV